MLKFDILNNNSNLIAVNGRKEKLWRNDFLEKIGTS